MRAFKETRESNKTSGNSGYANLVNQIQNDMQTIANENVQALANYANKLTADPNANETIKEQIREMKSAQTAANEKNSNVTCQVIDTRKDYSSNNYQQEGYYNRRNDQYNLEILKDDKGWC